eukprot:NODE_24133_length_637_cov_2.792157.p2 GENE.NODE_24133_length_637_cov_2.792157~~NODE_24133_length_637_cov_2.792157.p2  ORF type:complete len:102 (-),score=19.15 NODE_24133_length_637_cov_2.792157:226-531(-)
MRWAAICLATVLPVVVLAQSTGDAIEATSDYSGMNALIYAMADDYPYMCRCSYTINSTMTGLGICADTGAVCKIMPGAAARSSVGFVAVAAAGATLVRLAL